MIKAAIFDFDGTLINTNDLIFEGLQYLATRYRGEKLPTAVLKGLSGKSLFDQLSAIHPDKVAVMEAQFQIWYKHNHNTKAKVFPGVPMLLNHLNNMGIEMGIVTNNSREVLTLGLNHLGIGNYFSHQITRNDVAETKPHPEGLMRVLEAMALRPEEVIFVGDTENDILAAARAGVISAFVGWSVLDTAQLQTAPNYVLNEAEDLLHIVKMHNDLVA
ncbi:MAG: pyrophosphatase PpaX [Clostridiales bacterium]|jgi:pyrophosphatase PpaX|nr:pyrophosphatase PpaX [Clostridiales bacterium]MDN5298549.1 pyrophosphatase PpaX [Clostridiales bacterium]